MKFKSYQYNSLIIGTGAAGYNAADLLYSFGVTDIAIITENENSGTSRNTGSDKQTYYKLSMAGDSLDSVGKMAQTYFNGRSMDGEHALIEAALSSKCFFRLVELGVEFPHNDFGEYVGYKTDHDPSCRATSIGPYTSRKMTECLESSVKRKGILLFDHRQVIKLIVVDNSVYGIITYNSEQNLFEIFYANNVLLATGGPAGMFADSVYPTSQFGASGIAFEAGAKGKNLTEWQCGLASLHPRWNVSGSYMQVIPRIVSTEQDGSDEREFLLDYFSDEPRLQSLIFLKGYQWPFDVRKIMRGSSLIDVMVFYESQVKNRKVYLDFMHNLRSEEFDSRKLTDEAKSYLDNAKANFGIPVERLRKMNEPAYQLYLNKGVNLETEMLEIGLCVQHNNGGIAVDSNWETNVQGLYAIGEVAGTHGVYRPGGSALNAGQVGSLRAAQHIALNNPIRKESPEAIASFAQKELNDLYMTAKQSLDPVHSNLDEYWINLRKKMSKTGAAIRDKKEIEILLNELRPLVKNYGVHVFMNHENDFDKYYRLRSIVISQYVYLSAMLDYSHKGIGSRGSALYSDFNGDKPISELPDLFRFVLEDEKADNQLQEVSMKNSECKFIWRKPNPIPQRDLFFENVWKKYRETREAQ